MVYLPLTITMFKAIIVHGKLMFHQLQIVTLFGMLHEVSKGSEINLVKAFSIF
jgi:hypothetical protein